MNIDRLTRVKIRSESQTEMEEKIIPARDENCPVVPMLGEPIHKETSSVYIYFRDKGIIDLCVCSALDFKPTIEELLELFKKAKDGQGLRDMIRKEYIIVKE